MIQSIDLRIGNWVEITGKGFVQIVNGQSIDTLTLSGANPIPITHSLLLAFGFIQRGESELYDLKGSNFTYHLGVRRVTIFHPGNAFWHWLGSHIDHVHQIQNLYYCLIGRDLVLNSNTIINRY
ncbi:hypothetical protein [Segetibacter aerophilus]|uniref:Uncharacterized protein n=1 Tax=Segetibacter aerophilus TaxID=670293 RepID=A0A512BJY3_9BACT|nr:hypothetical protein [Segetibacter aerophilus]GEO12268.1 hypothetical protein SAE01_47640 [Segetibacter aerophilus]